MAGLQFAPWSSDIELSFYSALASLKINHDKLDDAARKIVGRYEVRPADPPERSARMQIHGNAFTVDELPIGYHRAEGILKNVNTIEEYNALDRKEIMDRAGRSIWDAILDGTIYSCPSLLSSFYAIFFADLKKYRFTYHFAFPAIHSDPPWKLNSPNGNEFPQLAPTESALLFDSVQTWKYAVDNRQHGFFLAKRDRNRFKTQETSPNGAEESEEGQSSRPQTPRTPKAEDFGFQWVVGSLSTFENGFFDGIDQEDRFVCFVDPSTYPQNPGWMLRNLLVLVRQRWRLDQVQILCYRDTHSQREKANSLVLNLKNSDPSSSSTAEPQLNPAVMPKVTGWERNENNKLNSRLIDLSEYLDPKRLADQSVDLNLKLMKWRIAPDLDLDVIKNTKCLLLGAGTLGSYVARNLLGWGVKKITFVDNGKVSFSNPVRQPLFAFKDCVDGGVKKALRAAEMLEEIYPGVDAKGIDMSVPMAGHPITDEESVKKDFEKLQRLIEEHDAIFLLMDTRESRWLPTVMGKSSHKIVVNAALGFDSYVVMRHGGNPWRKEQRSQQAELSENLGCYFCNDVVAPADSVKDQTLDQQCTVTRPGIAAIASALLVELLVSILQHPLLSHAPAPSTHAPRSSERDPPNHPLGLIPHQIRGFLTSFDNLLIRGPAYECCSACSEKVVLTYEKEGWKFVKKALNERGYVEELSGLAEVQRKAEEAAAQLDWEEEDEGLEEAEEGDGELI